MALVRLFPRQGRLRALSALGLLAYATTAVAHPALPLSGRVTDANGHPLHQAAVSLRADDGHGADVTTVFTDERGAFAMPAPVSGIDFEHPAVSVRKLGYRQVEKRSELTGRNAAVSVSLVMEPASDQADAAPASAWLAGMDEKKRSRLLQDCAGCHQMPSPSVRRYARLIDNTIAGLASADAAGVRRQAWSMIERYMDRLAAEDAFRGMGRRAASADSGGPRVSESGRTVSGTVDTLGKYFVGSMDRVEGYHYRAPLLVSAGSVVYEYEMESPGTISEALMLGSVPQLWVVDARAENAITRIDPPTGLETRFVIPTPDFDGIAPHLLRRGADDTLWVASLRHAIVARYDPDSRQWSNVVQLKEGGAPPVSIDALSVGFDHAVRADTRGRVWFLDCGMNAVGHFVPETGVSERISVPEVARRPLCGAAGPAGLVMNPDGTKVWFGLAGAGALGSVDTVTRKVETFGLRSPESGVGGIAMNEDGVLFAALMGSGQLLEYRPWNGEQVLHELPDRASGPRSVTYDPERRVLWIATSNADLVYRFDPRSGEFSALPLPRQGASLRSVAVAPLSGRLVGSYAIDHASMPGVRRTLAIGVIDPGDRAHRAKETPMAEGGARADAQ